MQWTSDAIKIFFFPRTGTIPADIEAGNPDPSTWGTPTASFSGGNCDIDANFMNHNIVFDTTFCGQWAVGFGATIPFAQLRRPHAKNMLEATPPISKTRTGSSTTSKSSMSMGPRGVLLNDSAHRGGDCDRIELS